MMYVLILKRIFLAEKCSNIMIQWFEIWKFGILSFFMFLNEIFLAEKCSNIIHQWFEIWKFGISFSLILKRIFLARNSIERNDFGRIGT
jgi:hypothetical protein